MLIKTFKTNYFLQLVLIIIIPMLLWVYPFTNPVEIPKPIVSSLLYESVYNFIHPYPFVAIIAGFVLVICEGFLINLIFAQNSLIPKTTLLPAFLYILLMSYDSAVLILNPVIIVNLFLILGLKALFESTRSVDSLGKIYTSSLYFSIATLFFYPAFVFWLLIIVALVIYKIYHWREWFVSILGFLAPIIFIFTLFFLLDKLGDQLLILHKDSVEIYRMFSQHVLNISYINIPYLIFVIILLIWSIISVYQSMHDHVIFFRKKCHLVIWYLLFSIILFVCMGNGLGLDFFAVPFCLLFCLFLSSNKQKSRVHDVVLLIFILFTFINVYLLW